MDTNKLSLNVSKTKLVEYSHCNAGIYNGVIGLEGNLLRSTECCVYLGVKLDEGLNFAEHVGYIVGKVSKSIGILYRAKHHLPTQSRIDFYYSFIYPILSYCIIVWGGTCSSYLKNLIIQQKKALRIIADVPFRSHTSPLFKKFNILKLNDVYKFNLAVFMFKNRDKFICSHNINTRQREQSVTEFHRLTKTQRAVSFMGPRIWNSLPQEIRDIRSFSRFKIFLKKYFTSSYT